MDDEYNQRLQLERQVSKFKDDLDELRKKHEDTSRDRDRKGKQLDIVSSEKAQLERFRDELVKSREELIGEKEKLVDLNNQLQMKRDALEESVADMEMENQRKSKEITRWSVRLSFCFTELVLVRFA